ncbi:P-selectin glycoprotein ligand 1 [Scomber japonicus]|uniref:P-selectin glycoprotein ligand 1 n=1 Tax=Scomber japonicus TaxID=13676 RepID=UPI0023069C2B|nr:P-selectin glycoprotein ligand 1 [Scomber japonicus]
MNVSAAAPSTAPVTVSEISSVTVAMSSSMSTYINELHVTTKSYSTNSSDDSTQAARNFSSPSKLSTTATTTNTSSEASEVLTPNSTASPTRISEISAVSTELSSVSQPVSATRSLISTSHVPDTAKPSSTTESPTPSISTDPAKSTAESPTHSISTDPANSTAESPIPSISTDPANSTAEPPTPSISTDPANSTAVSTSLVGVLIPRVPKKLPIPTTKSTPATTTAAHEVSKCPPITEVKPCSSRRVVNICLITIASLALLATIFMVSTIVLCVKLSARKYKVRKPHYETEMMCISTLLPDRTNNYTRERNPIANGVRVFPNGRDYDDDGGDDVTLSSFLPDNDRYI